MKNIYEGMPVSENYWITKEFKSRDEQQKFIDKNKHRFQMEEVFIDNGYALDVRKLKIINFT